MASQDLSFESIQHMGQFKEYKALFKKRIHWKAAKVRGVVFVKDFEGFKPKRKLIAYPITKPSNPNKAFKELQQAGIPANKMLVCSGGPQVGEDGALSLQLTPAKGSLSTDFVQQHGSKLFDALLKAHLQVGAATATAAEAATEAPTPPDTAANTDSAAPTDVKRIAQTLQQAIKTVERAFPALRDGILARIKAETATEDDQRFMQTLKADVQAVLEQYAAAPKRVQEHPQLSAKHAQIKSQRANIDRLAKMAGPPADQATNPAPSAADKRPVQEAISDFETQLQAWEDELEQLLSTL